jgi:hypothetical protein
MKKKYIVPHIDIKTITYENELAAGFNPGSKSPNPPGTKKSPTNDDNPELAPVNNLWEEEKDN